MYKCSSFCSFYKGEKFIEKYIKNLLEQSIFEEIEFIFLDCNSPEKEKEYIIPLTKKFNNIKYYKLEKDPGLYASWNIAISKCTSDIITNWNIDDRRIINSLELLYNSLKKDLELDVVYGHTFISTKANEEYNDNSFEEIYPCYDHSLHNLIRNNSPHCMPMWRKRIHDKVGFFEEKYKVASDGDMWLKCTVNGLKIKRINHPVGLYYHNPEGASTDKTRLKESINEVAEMRKKYIKYLL